MSQEKSISEKLAEIRLEKEQLELISLRSQVAAIQAKIQAQKVSHDTVEAALADKDRQTKNRQDACSHRKGGKGYEGLCGNGQDSMFAIARHRMMNGEIITLCLRCQKIWRKGQTEYNESLRFPTDNEMSESCQFSFSSN